MLVIRHTRQTSSRYSRKRILATTTRARSATGTWPPEKSHADCPKTVDVELPPLVIGVGSQDGSEESHLVEGKDRMGNYVSLSHCWGLGKLTLAATAFVGTA
ncbi:hypothetical protein BDY21DRAFT_173159 [Lineolata rhizophorae]|uniref:Uncharacterized protein n=1 Tax=Lineolata rhizophorae TaxID=578093 RepID=A0A6A6NL46_9PEZI|nr:hypothetical protein BDY21DRAFT_173159 [Lineolata rhizophorae]